MRPPDHTDILTLPGELTKNRKALEHAVAAVMPTTWPEGEKRLVATQAELIGKVLIRRLHSDVRRAKIGYLFQERMQTRATVTLGKAKKASVELHYYAELDFVIEFNHEAWLELPPNAKIALVDHELAHLGLDDTGQYCLVPHDVEEFGAIVLRWGLWRPSLVTFGHAVANQLELFEKLDVAKAAK